MVWDKCPNFNQKHCSLGSIANVSKVLNFKEKKIFTMTLFSPRVSGYVGRPWALRAVGFSRYFGQGHDRDMNTYNGKAHIKQQFNINNILYNLDSKPRAYFRKGGLHVRLAH